MVNIPNLNVGSLLLLRVDNYPQRDHQNKSQPTNGTLTFQHKLLMSVLMFA